MINQQLLDFIKVQLQKGLNRETIAGELLANGWTAQDIEEGFKNLVPASSVPIPNHSSLVKNKSHWKLILSIVVILTILGGGAYYFLQNKNLLSSIQSIKSVAIDDSVLQISPVSVPDSDNAAINFSVFQQGSIFNNPDFNLNEYLKNKNPDTQTVQKAKSILLQMRSADVLQVFDESTTKSKYYCDLNVQNNNCSLNDLRTIGQLATVKSDVLFREGKYKESMDEAFKVLDLGQKIENSADTQITYRVGSSIKNMALTEIQTVAQSGKLSLVDKAIYKQKLTQFTDDITGMKNSLKYEYLNKIKQIDGITSGNLSVLEVAYGGSVNRDNLDSLGQKFFDILNEYQTNKNPKFWNLNETKAMVYSGYKTALDYVDTTCGSKYPLQGFVPSNIDPQSENYIGKIMFGIFNSNIFETSINMRCVSAKFYEEIQNALN